VTAHVPASRRNRQHHMLQSGHDEHDEDTDTAGPESSANRIGRLSRPFTSSSAVSGAGSTTMMAAPATTALRAHATRPHTSALAMPPKTGGAPPRSERGRGERLSFAVEDHAGAQVQSGSPLVFGTCKPRETFSRVGLRPSAAYLNVMERLDTARSRESPADAAAIRGRKKILLDEARGAGSRFSTPMTSMAGSPAITRQGTAMSTGSSICLVGVCIEEDGDEEAVGEEEGDEDEEQQEEEGQDVVSVSGGDMQSSGDEGNRDGAPAQDGDTGMGEPRALEAAAAAAAVKSNSAACEESRSDNCNILLQNNEKKKERKQKKRVTGDRPGRQAAPMVFSLERPEESTLEVLRLEVNRESDSEDELFDETDLSLYKIQPRENPVPLDCID